jgi:hypothetical protein
VSILVAFTSRVDACRVAADYARRKGAPVEEGPKAPEVIVNVLDPDAIDLGGGL